MVTSVIPVVDATIVWEEYTPPMDTTHELTAPLTMRPKLVPPAMVTTMLTTNAGEPTVVRAVPAQEAVKFMTLMSTLVTVVPEGIPVPDMDCPTPTRTLLVSKENTLLVFVVAPVAVNTPTLDIEAPAVKVKPVGVPAVVVMAVPPKLVDRVKVVEPLVAVM
jgi:hypothetical protein